MATIAGPAPHETLMSMAVEADTPHPRLRIVLRGRIKGDDVVDAFIRLYTEQPSSVGYDRLFDLTDYVSGFEVAHLQRIAPAYQQANPNPNHPCRTAFVTRDPHFGLWARSMGFQFNGRDFRAFSTFEDAERFLDEPIAERPTPASA